MHEQAGLNLHEDVELFREAVNFTVSKTGFRPRLIEKDYFCTVLLNYLSAHGGDQLVFKGGTCLAKVHAGFYRLSEDLDFVIPMEVEAGRSRRRRAAAATKDSFARMSRRLPCFEIEQPLTGANNSTQYNAAVTYESPTAKRSESILIEVSVREPLLTGAVEGKIKTLLLDPVGGGAMVPEVRIKCMAPEEAMAEKFRAALSRRDVEIRDFYDLDYAVSNLDLDPADSRLIEMVRRKLAVFEKATRLENGCQHKLNHDPRVVGQPATLRAGFFSESANCCTVERKQRDIRVKAERK